MVDWMLRRVDFVYAEAAKDVENERDLRLLCQTRLATGEHHPKQIVFDRVGCKEMALTTSRNRSARISL
jgi:hypothetical protein